MDLNNYIDLFDEAPSSENIGDVFRVVINDKYEYEYVYIVVKGIVHSTALKCISPNSIHRRVPLSKWSVSTANKIYWYYVTDNELMAYL